MAIRRFCWTMLILFLLTGAAGAEQGEGSVPEAAAWFRPSYGRGRGTWDLRVGAHFWTDRLEFRNLRLRGILDLGPGLRTTAVLRSNQEFSGISVIEPTFDELYIEAFGFRLSEGATLSTSLRVGKIRYLRFPYPDVIAVFDQVPGIADLRDGHVTGYRGAILAAEYAHESGFGLHLTAIQWDDSRSYQRNIVEGYAFKRANLRNFVLEMRAGQLALRPEPLGEGALGWNVFAGYARDGFRGGLLYERISGQPTRTGVMIQFPLEKIFQWAGQVALDYTRSPQGFGVEIPLAEGSFGFGANVPPEGATLVGGLITEKVTTYWQNGQSRNIYEHYIDHWGRTEPDELTVIVEEEPWYLQLEALVSPHTRFNWEWERQRQGPAQLSRRVTYRYYELPEAME